MKVRVSLGGKQHAAQFEKATSVRVVLPKGGSLEIKEQEGEMLVLRHDDYTTECVWSQVDA